MQFVKSSVQIPKSNQLIMGSIIYNHSSNRTIPNSVKTISIPSNPPETSKKPKWGEPTWFLFHTLAHKLKEEFVPLVLPELFQMIKQICSNLPCPTCTKHATEYLNKIRPQSIVTKQDFKNLLFQFHNEVNQRKGYPLFEHDKLDEKYDTAILKKIIYYFLYHYKQKDFNISMITNNMHREETIRSFQSWIGKRIEFFDV